LVNVIGKEVTVVKRIAMLVLGVVLVTALVLTGWGCAKPAPTPTSWEVRWTWTAKPASPPVYAETKVGADALRNIHSVVLWTGDFEGELAADWQIVFRGGGLPTPAITQQAGHGMGTFKGKVLDKSTNTWKEGTLVLNMDMTVGYTYPAMGGTCSILRGTGELANLRGEGTMTGTSVIVPGVPSAVPNEFRGKVWWIQQP